MVVVVVVVVVVLVRVVRVVVVAVVVVLARAHLGGVEAADPSWSALYLHAAGARPC